MTATPTALLAPGTTLGLFCGSCSLLFCAAPWASLVFGGLGLFSLWRARQAVRRQPTVYRESGLRILTRLMILVAWIIAALVLLAGTGAEHLAVSPSDLW